jgi:hypothetical protein
MPVTPSDMQKLHDADKVLRRIVRVERSRALIIRAAINTLRQKTMGRCVHAAHQHILSIEDGMAHNAGTYQADSSQACYIHSLIS